jgi:hypothetical protein
MVWRFRKTIDLVLDTDTNVIGLILDPPAQVWGAVQQDVAGENAE